jgi:hypothetical protein
MEGLKHGLLGFDLYTKSTTIIDSGNQPFNACDMETIGLAVAGVLSHPAETANKYITITSHQTTQNEVLHALEQKTGSPWTVKREKGVEFYNASWDLMKAGINGWPAMLQSYNFRDRETPIDAPGTLDGNKLLGIGYKDVKNTVEEVLKTYPFSLLG